MDPKVTVIVPVYNRSALIGRCLSSIKAQSIRPLRVIVVDNNSTDGSYDTVKEWILKNRQPGLSVDLIRERKPGACAARNRGLEVVKSEYTVFFDSDDEMRPELLKKALQAIGNNDIVYWKGEVIALDGHRFTKPFHTRNHFRRQIINSILSTQLFMARTELIRKAGAWNEEAPVWNDWELGIRLLLHTHKIAYLPVTLVTIHAQKDSISGSKFHDKIGSWEKSILLAIHAIENSGLLPKKKKEYLNLIDYKTVILASSYHKEGYPEDGQKLLKATLSHQNSFRSRLLRQIYNYSKHGGRAAYYFFIPFT